jgi:hypothetical protein
MSYANEKECRRYGSGGSVQRAFVTIIEPGKVPDGKGPFLTRKHLEQFVREAVQVHPDRSIHIAVHQLTWNNELWTECGREMIQVMDAVDAALAETNGES